MEQENTVLARSQAVSRKLSSLEKSIDKFIREVETALAESPPVEVWLYESPLKGPEGLSIGNDKSLSYSAREVGYGPTETGDYALLIRQAFYISFDAGEDPVGDACLWDIWDQRPLAKASIAEKVQARELIPRLLELLIESAKETAESTGKLLFGVQLGVPQESAPLVSAS